MIRGLYCAAAGMDVQQVKVESIANNLANATTTGFKRESVKTQSFPDVMLVQQARTPHRIKALELNVPQAIGPLSMGVMVDEVVIDYAQGSAQETGRATDIVLIGPGFLAINAPIEGAPERVCYTRDGALKVDQEGYLTVGGVYRVLGQNGPIMVGDTEFQVTPNGAIVQDGNVVDRLQLMEFADLGVLGKEVSGIFVDRQGNGGTPAAATTVGQGYLERSNVNVADEMVSLVAVMRSYEANQRLIQVYDEQLAKTVNQVGSLR